MEVEFVVPGTPVAKGRPRFGRGGRVYTPKKTIDFENRVGFFFLAAVRERAIFWPEPGDVGALRIRVWSVFPVPPSLSKKRKAARYGKPHLQTPDASNLLKAVEDGLIGVAYKDDCVICDASVKKWWSQDDEEGHTVVRLEAL